MINWIINLIIKQKNKISIDKVVSIILDDLELLIGHR